MGGGHAEGRGQRCVRLGLAQPSQAVARRDGGGVFAKALCGGGIARAPQEQAILASGTASKVYAMIRGTLEERRGRAEAVLRRRCARWTEEVDDAVRGVLELSAAEAPDEVVTAVLKTVCYGWCTSRRFHNEVVRCHWCGAPGADMQEHHVACACLHEWAHERMGIDMPTEGTHGAILRSIAVGGVSALRMAVVVDALLFAVDASRHGSRASARGLLDPRHPATRVFCVR